MSILTVFDPDLLKHGLISIVWKDKSEFDADSLNLEC